MLRKILFLLIFCVFFSFITPRDPIGVSTIQLQQIASLLGHPPKSKHKPSGLNTRKTQFRGFVLAFERQLIRAKTLQIAVYCTYLGHQNKAEKHRLYSEKKTEVEDIGQSVKNEIRKLKKTTLSITEKATIRCVMRLLLNEASSIHTEINHFLQGSHHPNPYPTGDEDCNMHQLFTKSSTADRFQTHLAKLRFLFLSLLDLFIDYLRGNLYQPKVNDEVNDKTTQQQFQQYERLVLLEKEAIQRQRNSHQLTKSQHQQLQKFIIRFQGVAEQFTMNLKMASPNLTDPSEGTSV